MAEPPPSRPGLITSLATIGEDIPEKVRLSCFSYAAAAGDAEAVAASVRAELAKPMEKQIFSFYDEAIRRLPVAAMPELKDCVLTGGHCIGLLDPVSNIILNALNLLCRRRICTRKKKKRPAAPRKGAAATEEEEKASEGFRMMAIALSSYYKGLDAFLQTYFRYLSTAQGSRYLSLAGADLAVAVQLGQHQQFGPDPEDRRGSSPDLCSGRTQFALKVAAAAAGHPNPSDVALLATKTLLAPFEDPNPLAIVLHKGRLLSVDDVDRILSSLQRLHCPAVQVSFPRRPHPDLDQNFGLPCSQFSCVVDENYVARVSVSRYDGAVSSTCDLRTPDEVKQLLYNCLDVAATTIAKCCVL